MHYPVTSPVAYDITILDRAISFSFFSTVARFATTRPLLIDVCFKHELEPKISHSDIYYAYFLDDDFSMGSEIPSFTMYHRDYATYSLPRSNSFWVGNCFLKYTLHNIRFLVFCFFHFRNLFVFPLIWCSDSHFLVCNVPMLTSRLDFKFTFYWIPTLASMLAAVSAFFRKSQITLTRALNIQLFLTFRITGW